MERNAKFGKVRKTLLCELNGCLQADPRRPPSDHHRPPLEVTVNEADAHGDLLEQPGKGQEAQEETQQHQDAVQEPQDHFYFFL